MSRDLVYHQKPFLDRFFQREQREEKLEEFIILRQEGMSVKEFSLNFIRHSKYAYSSVSNARDEMIHYAMGISE